ncbi:MAG: hypothetical protein FJW20_10305 [Acidimicrobiia bacterium]|nr:hypothetical protein [Acidimicrobiia bacterium]
MRMRYAALWLVSLLPLAAQVEWKELSGGRIQLLENGSPVLSYNAGVQLAAGAPDDRARCCYIHPVWSPAGVVVTDDFPADHYHHRGLFWAWPQIVVDGKRLDSWMLRGVAPAFVKLHKAEGAELQVENAWMMGDRKLLREMVTIRHLKTGHFRLELELTPLVDLKLVGAPEAGKGYGGLSTRFAAREGTAMRSSEGEVRKDEDLTPHAWAEFEATYQGRRARLRITPDPSNPGEPNPWCLRFYGFLGSSWPARTPVEMKAGSNWKLVYDVEVGDVVQ